MRAFFLISIFLLHSCVSEIDLKRSKNDFFFQVTDSGVEAVTPVKWPVGPLRRQRVSRGLRLRIKYPQFKKADLRELVDKKGVDAWLMRIRKRSFRGSEIIGRVYVPLYLPGNERGGNFRLSQREESILLVYYGAAATSPRFANFMCPAFNHKYLIEESDIVGGFSRSKPVKVGSSEEGMVHYEVEQMKYDPPIFNAGSSMEGSYVIELALYSSVKNRRLSSFTPLENAAKVIKEKRVNLTGCDNFKIPGPSDGNEKIKQFNFGGKKKGSK